MYPLPKKLKKQYHKSYVMYDKFIKALSWNTAGAFFYKIILLTHQIILYSVVSQSLYGIIGTLFAGIYLTISLTNFGFEYTLLPFFQKFQQSKQHFQQVLVHLGLRFLMVFILSFGLYLLLIYRPFIWMHTALSKAPIKLTMILCGIFIFESIKKSMSTVMQLAFLNRQIVASELIMLVVYIVLVWMKYFISHQLTLFDIFMPLFVASILEVSLLSFYVVRFYKNLNNAAPLKKNQHVPLNIIAKQRVFNYINQVSKTLFSPNCMIIVLASVFGFPAVGTIKLFTNFISLIYTFLNKTVGITSGATFSATAYQDIKNSKPIFQTITKKYIYFLFSISISAVIYMLISLIGHNVSYHNIAWQIIPFFMVSFLDYLVITYEQFLIAHQSAMFLAIINIFNIAAIIGSIFLSYLSVNNILLIMLIVRLASIICIHEFVSIRWNINVLKYLKKVFMVLIFALLLFLCFF